MPGGKVSNWLHDNLQTGGQVRVLGPDGGLLAVGDVHEGRLGYVRVVVTR